MTERMTEPTLSPAVRRFQRVAYTLMALCLGVMAVAVFINVVLRYGFGSGVAASEELARLLFVWMVFIGAAAAYPSGEHMAFTSLAGTLQSRPLAFGLISAVVRLLVITGSVMLAWGAWQQVRVGMDTHSVVLGYPAALLPLPALLCSSAIALMAALELIQRKPLDLGHSAEVE